MKRIVADLLGRLGDALTKTSHQLRHRGRVPDGMPNVRDPDNPCAMFFWGTPGGGCQTDGHHLCRSCCYADKGRWTREPTPPEGQGNG